MRYIDDELLQRLKIGFSKGLFKSSLYYMAKEPTHANRLKVAILSLFQGKNSSYSPLCAQSIDLEKESNRHMLQTYQNYYVENGEYSSDELLLLGRPFYGRHISVSTYLTTKEISLLGGLPQKEVPGISLKESVAFGLNQKNNQSQEVINLGNLVQKGRELQNIPFLLSKDSMAKHTFIAGVTGSGKTTTCHRLLSEADMPFLVIEPAKTEYRTLINSEICKDVTVFTLGNEQVAPFRINPFELIEGEVISAHVDMIKATFTSAFPMEASMPQILEEAIYECYKKKGWNIDTNQNEKYEEVDSFPIMSDLLNEMKNVVDKKGFGKELKENYIGSLVSRLSNLTVGSKGSMLNCEHSTDFEYIAHHNVILEMEELKSPEDKALFMGFILSRLSAVIKAEHKKNSDFRHLTLIEEAHRLLSKVEYGDSGSKKGAVETFTDLLAEVRKYGEGLIVVDQIPNKLAPEVLKNTNTKIIHKILAKDDKEAVGDTMLMDDKQKEYLSALTVGQAIIFSENTDKPVHVHIKAISNTNEEQIDDNVVKRHFEINRLKFGKCYLDLGHMIELNYSKFDAIVCELLKARKLSDSECQEIDRKCYEFQESICRQANEYHLDINVVWGKLIERREKLHGIIIGEEVEKNRLQLTNFFRDNFGKEQFKSKNMVKDYQQVYILLMI